jgi:hypothetical protein
MANVTKIMLTVFGVRQGVASADRHQLACS